MPWFVELCANWLGEFHRLYQKHIVMHSSMTVSRGFVIWVLLDHLEGILIRGQKQINQECMSSMDAYQKVSIQANFTNIFSSSKKMCLICLYFLFHFFCNELHQWIPGPKLNSLKSRTNFGIRGSRSVI
jgi:hypothetical protein